MNSEQKIKRIIILGGNGDGVVIASLIHDINKHDNSIVLLGFLNDSEEQTILDYPVYGKLSDWKQFENENDIYFITALLKTKYSYQRSNLIMSLNIPLKKFCNIIHPTSTISHYARIGVGNVIGPSVNIMPNVIVGNHCSFRAGASIGHDCKINDFCYVGPNATMAGGSLLEDGSHMGPNSSLLDGKVIGKYSVLGMGSVSTKDIGVSQVYFGVPARKIGIVVNDYSNKEL